MTPISLYSAVDLVSGTARQLLDQHITERDITWIVKTAVIVEALKRSRGNKSRAAKMLGINRSSLKQQIREHHLESVIEGVEIFVDTQLELFARKKPSTAAQSNSSAFLQHSHMRAARSGSG